MAFPEKENSDIFVKMMIVLAVALFLIIVTMDVENKSKEKFRKWQSMAVASEILPES